MGCFAMQSRAMVDADPLWVGDLQTAVRADRRASSIPLFAAGAGALTVGFVNAGDIRGGPFSPFGWGWMLLPMVVFTTAWGVAFVHSRRLGLGTGHDGYGLITVGLDGRITWGDAVTPWALGSISLAAAVLVWRRERRLAQ